MKYERIVYMRETLELSQREMAKLLNISKSTYGRWETGEKIIPLKHLINMCNITMIPLDYALGLTNKKEPLKEKIKIDKKDFGSKLKQIRIKHNLTQDELAKMLNTTQSVISAYENGKNLIQTAFLYDECNKFEIEINIILKDS